MRNWIWVVTAALLMAGTVFAQEVPRDQPVTPKAQTPLKPKIPPASGKAPIIGSVTIGERAPDFWLDASTGRQEKLSSLRNGWLLLVFEDRYRTIAAFDSLDRSCRALGARVVGICHEKQQTLTSAVLRKEYSMLIMADVTGEVSAMYGLFDWVHGTTETGFFVIDQNGIVRLAIIGQLFPPEQLFELMKFATQETE